MARWVRFEREGGREAGFGTLDGDTAIRVHRGDMFADPAPTGETVPLASVRLLAPVRPGKTIALWNNFRALGAKLGVQPPSHPLYFFKSPTSYADPESTVRRPASYAGKVVYEGELGIVIGRPCHNADAAEAAAAIFGYTCVNDITAADILNENPNFAQWTRSKAFEGFGPIGPAIATGLRPDELEVVLTLNGAERQRYPVSDMVFPAAELVRLLSADMPLHPGDLISCGTSVGVGTMKEPTNDVAVTIEGIGTLRNTFVN